MKNYQRILIVLLIALPMNLWAQNYAELQNIKISDSLSCGQAQNKVVECCDYLFANPCVENLPSLNAMSFVIKWMGATPNFTFSIERKFYKAIKSDLNLTGRYHAALAKTAIANNYTKNSIDLQLKAITLLLDYCEQPKNYVKLTKKLRKYMEAKSAKELKEMIRI